MAQNTAVQGKTRQSDIIRKHCAALTLEARLMLKAAEDPNFTMRSLDVTAVADLIFTRAAAILNVLEQE
jgi:hypothetical protein